MGVLVIGYAEVAAGSLGVAWEKVEEELVGSDCGQHAVATPNGWRVGGRAPACIRLGGNYSVWRPPGSGKGEGSGWRRLGPEEQHCREKRLEKPLWQLESGDRGAAEGKLGVKGGGAISCLPIRNTIELTCGTSAHRDDEKGPGIASTRVIMCARTNLGSIPVNLPRRLLTLILPRDLVSHTANASTWTPATARLSAGSLWEVVMMKLETRCHVLYAVPSTQGQRIRRSSSGDRPRTAAEGWWSIPT